MTDNTEKSTVEEIRDRFDADVDRFSNLETGQTATIDAALAMELIAKAAAQVTPQATNLLDIGCGAGNYSLKLLQYLPDLEVTLVDLSLPMLERARIRIAQVSTGPIHCHQQDLRDLPLQPGQYDIILAAAVLHHLRTPEEWLSTFSRLYDSLRPGGSCWIFDLVESSNAAVQQLMWQRYGEYLTQFRNEEYRDQVFEYIAREDSPQTLLFQLNLLQQVGFDQVEVLHKNGCFAAFGGIRN